MSPLTASVAVPAPVRRLFTYSVPPELRPQCRRGVRVVVPFGRRKLTGYLIEVAQAPEGGAHGIALRPLERVLDADPVLDEAMLELTRWAADYYVASWGEMIRAALPGLKAAVHRVVSISPAGRRALRGAGGGLVDASPPDVMRDPLAREVLGIVSEFADRRGAAMRLADLKRRIGGRLREAMLSRLRRAGLLEVSEVAVGSGPRPRVEDFAVLREGPAPPERGAERPIRPRGRRQQALLALLRERGGRAAVPELLKGCGADRSTLRSLERQGLVCVEEVEAPRRPLALDSPPGDATPQEPTPEQREALETIASMLDGRRFATCLIHGATGSGKTEVYLRAIEAALASGRRSLYLVPEIGLTPLLARRMRARFGDVLALLHSGLSEGERYDEWRRIREGRASVVLGARSAVFAPIPGLGLIVVDEEHDASYKQDEYPRYNGRDLAVLRGKMADAVVVLGSATPSVESYRRALLGRCRLLRMPTRIGGAGMPAVERIDMRREFEELGREPILSRRLAAAIDDRLRRREQTLVLLNRRGFSTFVLCRACGEPIHCRRCSIAMTLHLKQQRLRCHYCDDSRRVPACCPACGSGHLHFGGTGTERLEQVLRARFPSARVARMDRDTVSGRGAVEGILTRVERGQIDILLGTQMIAKGHDFPNVTLVGVLAADALLGRPDFRAGERTFQLLSQVAGRSGRRDRPGEVIVQAYYSDHHAIRYAAEHDFEGFARKELAYRRVLSYPPYSALAVVLVKDRRFERAKGGAGIVARILRGLGSRSLQVLGPAPAPLERLRGEYRVQVLVKAGDRREMQETLPRLLAELDRRKVRLEDLVIDVDPTSTL
ncbi:MAG: primosomal protein N' [Acidobacteriota bacterium]